MKKLSHFLQAGRLVNIDNFSVYTIASVLKKFLRKIPGGIFGRINEQRLFHIITLESMEEQRNEIHRFVVGYLLQFHHLSVWSFGLHAYVVVLIYLQAYYINACSYSAVTCSPLWNLSCYCHKCWSCRNWNDVWSIGRLCCSQLFPKLCQWW